MFKTAEFWAAINSHPDTLTAISARAGGHQPALTRAIREGKTPTISYFVRLCNSCGFVPSSFIGGGEPTNKGRLHYFSLGSIAATMQASGHGRTKLAKLLGVDKRGSFGRLYYGLGIPKFPLLFKVCDTLTLDASSFFKAVPPEHTNQMY